MSQVKPSVSWKELQRRKLLVMQETVRHFKEVSGIRFSIHPNVYPPGTDTHLLANTVKITPGDTALDLCTGNGAIALKMAMLGAEYVEGVDINHLAIINAQENKKLIGGHSVLFYESNMFNKVSGKFDVITINPPYTDKEPADNIEACFYDKGHEALKSFFRGLNKHLKPHGKAYIAWSNIGSMTILPALARSNSFNLSLEAEDIGGRGYKFYVYTLQRKSNA